LKSTLISKIRRSPNTKVTDNPNIIPKPATSQINRTFKKKTIITAILKIANLKPILTRTTKTGIIGRVRKEKVS
jgi:hypothetical protein